MKENGGEALKKILITGCNGQLGRALNQFYAKHPDIQLINTDVEDLDIANANEVMEYVSKIHPDIIINCAAYTNVDDCEKKSGIGISD